MATSEGKPRMQYLLYKHITVWKRMAFTEITPMPPNGEIRLIQEALIKNGYRLAVDGAVGSETLAAITDFQKKIGLSVDGIVGNETLKALGIEIPPTVNQTEMVVPSPTVPPLPAGIGNGQRVCINPGHGGSDPGACDGT